MSNQLLKILSCNIESDRHLGKRLLPLFKKENLQLATLQEVLETDLERIAAVLGLEYVFVPMSNLIEKSIHFDSMGKLGLAIFAPKIISHRADYYFGSPESLPKFYPGQIANSMNRILLSAKVEVEGKIFNLATTHFTWSGDATIMPEQRRDFKVLGRVLDQFDDLILTGDFNSPRGGAIFDTLAARYQDNIPENVITTIDKNLHKSGKDIRLVVDALFTTPHYLVNDVQVLDNTSDHKAILAKISYRSES